MASLIIRALFLTTILLLQYNSLKALPFGVFAPFKINSLATGLLPLVAGNTTTQNIVYSPASIYASLALMYLGAQGRTADEISTVLQLDENDKINFAKKFGRFLKTNLKRTYRGKDAPQLSMSNRLYVSNKIKVLEKFNQIAQKNFDSAAESVDFSQAAQAVDKINKWVEQQTGNKIKNLMQPDALNGDTSAFLVNTIYFKGNWLHPFVVADTHKNDFHISSSETVQVDTMYSNDYYGYADLPDLQAEALELAYKNSDISMLIIIPKAVEGLKELEDQLKTIDLNEINSKVRMQKIKLFLPKFRIDFKVDLKEPLEKLGCSTMFSDKADFMEMFESNVSHGISDVKQKVFLDCNEYGSEAAAATYFKFELLSISQERIVRVDRPFFFAIRSTSGVLFAGHVVRI